MFFNAKKKIRFLWKQNDLILSLENQIKIQQCVSFLCGRLFFFSNKCFRSNHIWLWFILLISWFFEIFRAYQLYVMFSLFLFSRPNKDNL
jgi:hypothetical protein